MTWRSNEPNRKNWFHGKTLESISLYESQAQKAVEINASKEKFPIYVCGLTPYDSAHLGHAFTYSVFDVLIRFLKQSEKKISYVQNITDVDDPLFERARRDGLDWKEIAESQIKKFVMDMQAISINAPDVFVSVSDEMPIIIESNSRLNDKNLLYQLADDWYYQIEKIDSKLVAGWVNSQLLETFSQRGGDPDRIGKRNPFDAVVWKSSAPDEPAWESTLGLGRPGWHIECVSIIEKYLDLPLFIQGGGKDLIFPHHAICAMQAQSLSGKRLAENYLHAGLVSYQGEKMSKSLGNLVFVSDLMEMNFSAAAIRAHLLSQVWYQDWEWIESDLATFQMRTDNWRHKLSKIQVTDELIDLAFSNLQNNLNAKPIFEYLDNLSVTQNIECDPQQSVSGFMSDVFGIRL
jgi:L-cysteine:1D-myo-inositol 2-amino-2-deoxy-alpha-D-glucopyranoside ligase